jgi:hypothetical protein
MLYVVIPEKSISFSFGVYKNAVIPMVSFINIPRVICHGFKYGIGWVGLGWVRLRLMWLLGDIVSLDWIGFL